MANGSGTIHVGPRFLGF